MRVPCAINEIRLTAAHLAAEPGRPPAAACAVALVRAERERRDCGLCAPPYTLCGCGAHKAKGGSGSGEAKKVVHAGDPVTPINMHQETVADRLRDVTAHGETRNSDHRRLVKP